MAFLPNFQSASFKAGASINNQFFPLSAGTVLAYTGVSGGEDVEANDFFATSLTRIVNGVQTMVVRDTAYEEGLLVEDTLDYFAQDTRGNVWYLGETVINYEYDDDGNFIGTNNNGAWLAGENGARPGWIMPARPTLGFTFFNEFAPNAKDEAEIVGVKQHIQTDLGRYTTLKTKDSSSLDPGIVEFKHYAPGVGIIRVEEELDANGVPGLVSDLTEIVRAGSSRTPSGTNPAQAPDCVSDGDTHHVTIIAEDAEFDNALGYYTFDPATGVIGEARIIFDGSTGAAGDTIPIDVANGTGIGFFLVPDSSELGVDLSQFDDGGLFFRNMLTDQPAQLTDGMAPIVTDDQGHPLPIPVFHLLGASTGTDLLNPGIGLQGVEWDLGKDDPETHVLLGFEDHRQTDGDYDGDFNDLLIVFGDGPVDPGDFSLHVLGQSLPDALV